VYIINQKEENIMMNESLLKELNFSDEFFGNFEVNEILIAHCPHSKNNRSTFKPLNPNVFGNDRYGCTNCGKMIDLSENISKDAIERSSNIVSTILNLVQILKLDLDIFLRFYKVAEINSDVRHLNSIALVQYSVRNNIIPLYNYIKSNIPMINFDFTKEELIQAIDIIDQVFDIIKFSIYNLMYITTKVFISNALETDRINLNTNVELDLLDVSRLINEYKTLVFDNISVNS
jgi:hypothetical protein